MIRKLVCSEHGKTRGLYEEVFPEDDAAFVDYYYEWSARENQIYIAETREAEIAAMLHLNPYQVNLGQQNVDSQYIVAVATKEEYRHQGMMSRLIKQALADMFKRQEPFVFLMPAKEAIYRPFDFRFIYDRKQCSITGAGQIQAAELKQRLTGYECRPVRAEDLQVLSQWAKQRLRAEYRTFTKHTESYFARMEKEQEGQNGHVIVITKQGEICGYFFTAKENSTEVREAMIDPVDKEYLTDIIAGYLKGEDQIKIYGGMIGETEEGYHEEPKIMARIVHLERFVGCLTAKEPVSFELKITDQLISENSGSYLLKIDKQGGSLEMLEQKICSWQISIAGFTELAFGAVDIKDLDIPETVKQNWQQVCDLAPVMLNEIV